MALDHHLVARRFQGPAPVTTISDEVLKQYLYNILLFGHDKILDN